MPANFSASHAASSPYYSMSAKYSSTFQPNSAAASFVPSQFMQGSSYSGQYYQQSMMQSHFHEQPQYMQKACHQAMGVQQALVALDDFSDYSDDDEPSTPSKPQPTTPSGDQKLSYECVSAPAKAPVEPIKTPLNNIMDDSDCDSATDSEADFNAAVIKQDSAMEICRTKRAPPSESGSEHLSSAPSTCEPELNATFSSASDVEASDLEREQSPERRAEVPCVELDDQQHATSIANMLKVRQSLSWLEGVEDRLVAVEILPDDALYKNLVSVGAAPLPQRSAPTKGACKPRGKAAGKRRNAQKPAPKSKEAPSTAFRRSREERTTQQASANSWMAQQNARRSDCVPKEGAEIVTDEEVARTIKSILNKLTIEKFDKLSQKLLSSGISTPAHLETLINEVFEKATTQHHFIKMYADLCVMIHEHFRENPISTDPLQGFKRILLNGCQTFFEKHLTPPSGMDELDDEDRASLELKYKTQMLGNIKFVGALLVRQMLAGKVMFSIIDALITEPTPETLEALAALLTAVGPSFDTPDWPQHTLLANIFDKVTALTKDASINCRTRFLLKDVLELRANRWKDKRPKKMEDASTLKKVALDLAAEGVTSPARKSNAKSASHVTGKNASNYQRVNSLKGLFASKSSKEEVKQTNLFDKEACSREVLAAFAELRMSHDVQEALLRISSLQVPPSLQSELACDIMGQAAEEGSESARSVYFAFIAELYIASHWKPYTLGNAVKSFVQDVCADLKVDVPALPQIVRDELHPALARFSDTGKLPASALEPLAAVL